MSDLSWLLIIGGVVVLAALLAVAATRLTASAPFECERCGRLITGRAYHPATETVDLLPPVIGEAECCSEVCARQLLAAHRRTGGYVHGDQS